MIKKAIEKLLKKGYVFEFSKIHSFVTLAYSDGRYLVEDRVFASPNDAFNWLKREGYRYSRIIAADPNDVELVADYLATMFR
jgi:hypothetical protein